MNGGLTKTKEKYQAEDARRAIYRLVIQGKLDAIDLKIIEETWTYSSISSIREVAARLNIPISTTHDKTEHIKRLIKNELQ